MYIKYGIDVSEHNGVIDWHAVKDSGKVDFAMIRAGYGRATIDRKFHANASACNNLGIPIGIYWFSYAASPSDAEKEAKLCLDTIKPYKITYPVAYDFEDDSVRVLKKSGITINGKDFATMLALNFLNTIEAAGYTPANYTNPAYLDRYFEQSMLNKFNLWLAQWPINPKPDSGHSMNPDIWQYSDKGTIPGISTKVDLNVCYKQYEKMEDSAKMTSKEIYAALMKELDLKKQQQWFEKETDGSPSDFTLAKELGFTDGSRPYDIASRAEVMAMIARAMTTLRDELHISFESLERRINQDDGK